MSPRVSLKIKRNTGGGSSKKVHIHNADGQNTLRTTIQKPWLQSQRFACRYQQSLRIQPWFLRGAVFDFPPANTNKQWLQPWFHFAVQPEILLFPSTESWVPRSMAKLAKCNARCRQTSPEIHSLRRSFGCAPQKLVGLLWVSLQTRPQTCWCDRQGIRNGMTPITPQLVVSFKGTKPGFIPLLIPHPSRRSQGKGAPKGRAPHLQHMRSQKPSPVGQRLSRAKPFPEIP